MPASLDQKLAFRSNTKGIFELIEKQFNIFPLIALVQSAHESNWGLSQLAFEQKNIFGMTVGEGWKKAMRKEVTMETLEPWSSLGNPTGFYPTTEYSNFPPEKIRYWEFPGDVEDKRPDGKGGSILTVKRYFRKYADWHESSVDWGRKISREPRYRFAYEAAKVGDVVHYADCIQKSGYATDQTYQASLIHLAAAIQLLPMI